jgi:hypothetical protein
MTDTTNINELPSDPYVSENKVVMEQKEMPEYENILKENNNSNNNVPSAAENQKIMNELVSGIQQASASGATQLPSRDIPMNTNNITQDPSIQPNYVAQNPNDDYINQESSPEDYLINNQKKSNKLSSIESIMEDLQTPFLLGILYFIFQLPFIKKLVFKHIPLLCHKDSNLNLGGYLFFSVLFAITYFSITHIIKTIDI